ncbi:hypothetical protein Aperf_G00000038611 [Anoplocephala perfoliata]
MSLPRPEETTAIERCIRSFVIKSIYGVVQARSGNAFATACISDVGARNNLMVYLEEDPEIGATIKQNLDSNVPIKMGDTISLEILLKNSADHLVVLEIWQFRLDTEDSLLRRNRLPCSKVVANHSGLQPTISSLPTTPIDTTTDTPATQQYFAVQDFRRSRLFERLGSLLKSLLVTTRMLPAYNFSRNQQHLMCYTLRRVDVSLDRLGTDSVICRQVGHLAPGLAVGPDATNLFLNVSVRYRGSLDDIDLQDPIPQLLPQPQSRRSRSRRALIRPAFATAVDGDDEYLPEEEEEEEEGEYDGDYAYRIRNEGLPVEGDTIFDEATGCYYYFQDDGEAIEGSAGVEESEESNNSGEMSRTFVSVGENDEPAREENGGGDRSRAPLHLAFASLDFGGDGSGLGVGGGCARMAHLVTELRSKTDLDLFRVPGAASNPTSTSSVFDPNALGDELERHEKTLKEFDDFLVDFLAAQLNFNGVKHH